MAHQRRRRLRRATTIAIHAICSRRRHRCKQWLWREQLPNSQALETQQLGASARRRVGASATDVRRPLVAFFVEPFSYRGGSPRAAMSVDALVSWAQKAGAELCAVRADGRALKYTRDVPAGEASRPVRACARGLLRSHSCRRGLCAHAPRPAHAGDPPPPYEAPHERNARLTISHPAIFLISSVSCRCRPRLPLTPLPPA